MADDKPNGHDTQVTLRIFIDCDNVAQVGAIMSTCETMGLLPKLVPHTLRGAGKTGPRRSKYGLLQLGQGAGGKYDKQFKRAKEILKDGPVPRIDLVSQLAKTFRTENKRTGYMVKLWMDSGALKDA
jgi:hypothetical protein